MRAERPASSPAPDVAPRACSCRCRWLRRGHGGGRRAPGRLLRAAGAPGPARARWVRLAGTSRAAGPIRPCEQERSGAPQQQARGGDVGHEVEGQALLAVVGQMQVRRGYGGGGRDEARRERVEAHDGGQEEGEAEHRPPGQQAEAVEQRQRQGQQRRTAGVAHVVAGEEQPIRDPVVGVAVDERVVEVEIRIDEMRREHGEDGQAQRDEDPQQPASEGLREPAGDGGGHCHLGRHPYVGPHQYAGPGRMR